MSIKQMSYAIVFAILVMVGYCRYMPACHDHGKHHPVGGTHDAG